MPDIVSGGASRRWPRKLILASADSSWLDRVIGLLPCLANRGDYGAGAAGPRHTLPPNVVA
jgi:hypothetical protein